MNIRKTIKEEMDWISNVSAKDGFNIDDIYDIPFYELDWDGQPKTRRGIQSKFVVKDVGDSKIVNLCRFGDTPGLGNECAMFGKKTIIQHFASGDFVFVHEFDKINESNDFEWIDDISGKLLIGHEYEILAPNNRSWIPLIYCGEGTTNNPHTNKDVDGHRFRDVDSDNCNSWYSLRYVDELISKGRLRPKAVINESQDFDWIKEIPNNPLMFVDHGIEFDEDGPHNQTSGKDVGGEIWVDVRNYSLSEKGIILNNIEKILETPTYFASKSRCVSDDITAYLIHCGDEDNSFVPKKNNICCMQETYDDFIMGEEDNDGNTHIRPIVDGGIFLDRNINESQDFDWIRSAATPELGKLFSENEVCFGDEGCEVNINDNVITYELEWNDFEERVELDSDNSWYLEQLIKYGPNYDGGGDYYDFDYDEFDYAGHSLTPEEIEVLQDILDRTSEGTVLVNDLIGGDGFSEVVGYLKYPPLEKRWMDYVDNHLNIIGYSIQRNRWNSLSATYQDILEKNNINISTEVNRWRGVEVIVKVPFGEISNNNNNISDTFLKVLEPLTDGWWYDWFHDEWDTSGGEDEISHEYARFIEFAEEYLNDGENKSEWDRYFNYIKSVGFKSISKARNRAPQYIKPVSGENNTNWVVEPYKGSTDKVKLKLFINKQYTYSWPNKTVVIPTKDLGEYPNNYQLDLKESRELEWIKDETPNFSDWYDYWGNDILRTLPKTLDEVEPFAGGVYVKRLFTLDVLNKQIHRYIEENEIEGLSWGDIQEKTNVVYQYLTTILKIIRDKDEDKLHSSSRDIYKRAIKNLEVFIKKSIDGLRRWGL
jgi:hypothetical protein